MNELSVEKWRNEICGSRKGRKPEKNLLRFRFFLYETHIERPGSERGIPAVESERLIAYATELPSSSNINDFLFQYSKCFEFSEKNLILKCEF